MKLNLANIVLFVLSFEASLMFQKSNHVYKSTAQKLLIKIEKIKFPLLLILRIFLEQVSTEYFRVTP